MRMGGAKLMRRTVRSAEGDRDVELPAGHREHVGSVVHHLIERDQRKTESHELDDRPQSDHGRAHSQPGKSIFADRRVDDSLRPETLEQSLAYFVSAVVFGDFLAHQENIRIALEFFGERFVERLAVGDFSHALSSSTGRGGSPEPPGRLWSIAPTLLE